PCPHSPPRLYPLSLHDALPILRGRKEKSGRSSSPILSAPLAQLRTMPAKSSSTPPIAGRQVSTVKTHSAATIAATRHRFRGLGGDRKSTRLNSSHVSISYAVFC